MSRADVLVDADWAEAHLDDPKIVFVEVGLGPVGVDEHVCAAHAVAPFLLCVLAVVRRMRR